MKRLKLYVASLIVAVLGTLATVTPATVSALNPLEEACQSGGSEAICQSQGDQTVGGLINTIVNILLFIIGIVSVIMIIVGGFMFATSAGDAGRVTKAKNTILYAVIGLVIAFVAYAVVNFVLARL